eukprot:SAG22_NODE_2864_length_2143_cov_66.695205_2_plen_73_part_00
MLDQLEEGETLASVLAAEGSSSERVVKAKSRWFLSDGSFSWEPCFVLEYYPEKNEFLVSTAVVRHCLPSCFH